MNIINTNYDGEEIPKSITVRSGSVEHTYELAGYENEKLRKELDASKGYHAAAISNECKCKAAIEVNEGAINRNLLLRDIISKMDLVSGAKFTTEQTNLIDSIKGVQGWNNG